MSQALRLDARGLGWGLGATVVAGGVGLFVGHAPLLAPFLLVAGIAVGALAFLRTELAIHLLILSMLLSPEFAVGGSLGGGSLEASRAAVLRIEDLLLVTIGVAWLAKTAVHKQLGLFLATPLNWPIGLYALVIVSSTLIGAANGRVSPLTGTMYVAKYLEYFVIYFVVVSHIRDRRALNRVLVTAAVTAALVALVAILQIPSGERISAPFEGARGEPNTLGGYLVLMMAVLGGIALEAPRRKQRVGLGLLIALLAVPLLYTLSRSSWLAAGATLLVLALCTRQRRRLLGVAIVAVVLLLLLLPERAAERVEYTFTEHRTSVYVGGRALDASASERVRSWSEALEDSGEHPLLGYGVTGYHFIDAQYFRILVECGVLGLASFGLLILLLYRNARRAAREISDPYLRGMSAGFLAALAGLLVHALGANTFIIIRIMEPFWLFAGLVSVARLVDAPPEDAHASA